MATRSYSVEVINWVWQVEKKRLEGDMFYFADHHHPRIKRFRTQKAAREWLQANGFEPYGFCKSNPFLFKSMQGGMEARLVRDDGTQIWPL